MRALKLETIRCRTGDGRQALTEIPVIPFDASPVLREGLSRRRYCARKGACRCGATRAVDDGAGEVEPTRNGPAVHLPFNHAPDCPAHSDILGPAIEAWANAEEVPDGAASR
jgi:hypothetical protein